MQNITKQKRIEVYRNANQVVKDLYGSEILGERLEELSKKYSLGEQDIVLINTVGDIILGFYKIADLPRLLQQNVGVSADESQRITSALMELLSPVVTREEAEKNEKKEELASLAQTFAQKSAQPAVPSETSTQETVTEKIPAMRTMHSDMDRIHGYGSVASTQDDDEPTVSALSQEETFTPTPPQPPVTQLAKEVAPKKVPIANNTSWSSDDSGK